MKLHKNAALTPKQRQEIQRQYATGQVSYAQLTHQFAVSRKTVIKWAKRTDSQDQTSAPKKHHQRVTDAYRLAVITYRQANPTHGPVRIERQLRDEHGPFAPSTVRLILKAGEAQKSSRPKMEKLPMGRYRTQMDIQQLPTLKGNSGFDGAARAVQNINYSSSHPHQIFGNSRQLSKRDGRSGLQAVAGYTAPFFITFTDNAMTGPPERFYHALHRSSQSANPIHQNG